MGIERVVRRWRFQPEAAPDASRLVPDEGQVLRAHLIEPPLEIYGAARTEPTQLARRALDARR